MALPKRPLLAVLIWLAPPAALAASGAPAVQVRSVEVAQGGHWHPDPDGVLAVCTGPLLTRASAMHWFRRAREITRQRWQAAQDPGQCRAGGRLTTIYGSDYRWELNRAGRGRIILSPTASVFLAGPRFPDASP